MPAPDPVEGGSLRRMLTAAELERLEEACRAVPPAKNEYIATDVADALLATVVDYQMHTTAVVGAMEHFKAHHADTTRTMDDLERTLQQFPDDERGNHELARHLWGYQLWTRAQQLRGLVRYFSDRGIRDLNGLRAWAATSTFADFKGLGPAVYQWLVMRLGGETAKPDVRLLRFVSRAIGRPANERETIDGIEEVARRLGIRANQLDWGIWEAGG